MRFAIPWPRFARSAAWIIGLMGTSKNSASSPNAIKLPANDSASFSFRFIYVHSGAVSDRQWEQFFEVPNGHFEVHDDDIRPFADGRLASSFTVLCRQNLEIAFSTDGKPRAG